MPSLFAIPSWGIVNPFNNSLFSGNANAGISAECQQVVAFLQKVQPFLKYAQSIFIIVYNRSFLKSLFFFQYLPRFQCPLMKIRL